MPWSEVSVMDLRREFVGLATREGANVSQLCRRFGISRTCGYKWLARARAGGGLADRSRRPHSSPTRTPAEVEAQVLDLRDQHPAWGARKLSRRLGDLGTADLPVSTVQAILGRHNRITPADGAQRGAYQRFERATANELWQMDFKGHFAYAGGRCHPLAVLDDHTRYVVCLAACLDETGATVRGCLEGCFQRYGLPQAILVDHGAPWGSDPGVRYTPLTVWLMRLGIEVLHGRPYHPQTRGKIERLNRSLKAEVLQGRWFAELAAIERAFADWRHCYNHERPHGALDHAVPASRYRVSPRACPARLPDLVYGPEDIVRRVHDGGRISFLGHRLRLPRGLRGQDIALRPTTEDGVWDVYFMVQRVTQVDLRHPLDIP